METVSSNCSETAAKLSAARAASETFSTLPFLYSMRAFGVAVQRISHFSMLPERQVTVRESYAVTCVVP